MIYTIQHIMRLGLGSVLVVALSACHENDQNAELHDSEPSVSNGIFTFSQVADGSVRVRPTDPSSSFTRADAIEANMQLSASSVTASKTAVEIGTVEYTKFEYQLDGTRNCRWTKGMFLPSCTTVASQDTQAQNSQPTSHGPNVTQLATPIEGMTCANHSQYQTPIWQKKFRVTLAGDAAELDKVKEARYTVWVSYGKTFTGASRQDNFDAGASFLTPVTSWLIDPATIVAADGKEYPLPSVRLNWKDEDLGKPAGQPCEL